MQITYISSIQIPSTKAAGLAIMKQCEAFAELGNQVTLLVPKRINSIAQDPFEYYPVEKIFAIKKIPVFQFRTKFGKAEFYFMRAALMCSGLVEIYKNRKHVDLLYSRDPWMLFLPLLLLPQKKSIIEVHTKHNNWLIRFVIKRASKCIVISQGLKEFYAPMRVQNDIQVEPSGVDLAQFNDLPTIIETRHQLGLPKDRFIYGYIGKYTTMGEAKGVDEILEAFAEVYAEHKDAYLLIAGLETSEIEMVTSKLSELSVPADAYTLTKLDPKKFALFLHSCDVLIMNYPNTEHYAKFMSPTKLFAYMAAGKIIITSDLPSIRTIVGPDDVLFVAPGNKRALVSAMEESVRMYEVGGEMGERVKAKVRRFSWLDRGQRILEEIDSLNFSGNVKSLI